MSLLGAGQVIADITHTDIGKAYDCRNVDHASSILVRMLNQTDTFAVAFYAEHEWNTDWQFAIYLVQLAARESYVSTE